AAVFADHLPMLRAEPTQELPVGVAQTKAGLIVLLHLVMNGEATQPAVEGEGLNEAEPVDTRPPAIKPARPRRGHFGPFSLGKIRVDLVAAPFAFGAQSHEISGTCQPALKKTLFHPTPDQIGQARRQGER